MKIFRSFAVLFQLTLVVISVSAQDLTKPISGGVLNGKATSLPKPAYPPAARAVGASGLVAVQVLIDENGNVISATAVSGHPLLRAASVQAAQAATFAPTRLSGQPVKVSGVITYNFVGPLYTARIGFLLSYADRTATFGSYQTPASLAADLPSDWIEEKRILNSLTYEEGVVSAPPAAEGEKMYKTEEPAGTSVKGDSKRARLTVKGDVFSAASSPNLRLDSKSQSSLREVLKLAEARSSTDESTAWAFDVGRALSAVVADIRDESKFESNLTELESVAARAPSSAQQSSLRQLKEFIDYAKQMGPRDETRREILSKAESLSNLRF